MSQKKVKFLNVRRTKDSKYNMFYEKLNIENELNNCYPMQLIIIKELV